MVLTWRAAPRLRRDRRLWWDPPSVASLRALARVTSTVYLGGSLLIFVMTIGSGVTGQTLLFARLIPTTGLLISALTWIFAGLLPRWVFHFTAAGSTFLISAEIFCLSGTHAAQWVGIIYVFAVADFCFFFSWVGMAAQELLLFTAEIVAMSHAGASAPAIVCLSGSVFVVGLVVAWLARLADRADEDPLTLLPNRRALARDLETAIEDAARTGNPLVLMALDLDHFKTVNDTLGHAAGDEILVSCTRRWRHVVPDTRMLSRIGGDEFALILPGHTLGSAAELAEAIREAVKPEMTMSIGVAGWQHGDSGSMLMGRADVALYEAKTGGRDQVAVYGAPGHAARELEQAISEQQMVMYYQPVVRLSDGKIVSHEALVRWNHPQRGLIGPDEFVPRAEQTGAIHALGAWTLDKACRTLVATETSSSVSVNVSILELRNPAFLQDVRETVARCQLDPRRLILEVTEGVYDDLDDQVVHTLRELRGLGIRIAIDDFGAGYSSLRWLEDFPLDILKIDGTFVRRLTDETTETPVLQAIVALGQALDVTIIAEQVETEHQAALLRAIGCQCGQGYLFGAPGPELLREPLATGLSVF